MMPTMTADQPNIVVLLPDQLRWDFVGCYGAGFARTPAIDALAADGMRYDRAISPHPVCIPARASLLTGHNALATGVLTNGNWLRPDHAQCGMPTFAELLAGRGYRCAAIGKMHFIPWDIGEGVDHRRIAEDKRHVHIQDDYADYLARHGLKKPRGIDEDGYREFLMASISALPEVHQVDTWVGDEAVRFIDEQDGDAHGDDGPFLLMVGFPGPHDPYNPPADWAARFDAADMPAPFAATPESEAFRPGQIEQHRRGSTMVDLTQFPEPTRRRIRAHYCALVALIDRQVGRIVDALARKEQHRGTIIVFTSDHGDLLGDFDLIGKTNFFEPSMHVPLIVRMPDAAGAAGAAGAVRGDLVTLTDLFATILAAAGMPLADDDRDSYVLPGLGLTEDTARTHALGALGSGTMIMDRQYKLARYANGVAALYDIDADPMEQANRIDDRGLAPVRAALEAQLTRAVLGAVKRANLDKAYAYATLTPDHPSHARGWTRPYPVGAPVAQEVPPGAAAARPRRG